jgi:hypothetical protein
MWHTFVLWGVLEPLSTRFLHGLPENNKISKKGVDKSEK